MQFLRLLDYIVARIPELKQTESIHIWMDVRKQGKFHGIKYDEFLDALKQLESDDYIELSERSYKIRPKGRIFIKSGSYLPRLTPNLISNTIKNAQVETPKEKKQIFTLNNSAAVIGIIGVIVSIITTDRNTPLIGVDWWINFLGL